MNIGSRAELVPASGVYAMKMLRWVAFCGLAATSCLPNEEAPNPVLKLVLQLASSNFDTRDRAGDELTEKAAAHWDEVVSCYRDTRDPEVQVRILIALKRALIPILKTRVAVQREAFNKLERNWLEGEKLYSGLTSNVEEEVHQVSRKLEDMERSEAALVRDIQDLNDELAFLKESGDGAARIQALHLQLANLRIMLAERRASCAPQREALNVKRDALANRLRSLYLLNSELQRVWRKEGYHRITYFDQITQLCSGQPRLRLEHLCALKAGETFKPDWLTFADRFKLNISFDFVDLPMEACMREIAELSGIGFELKDKDGSIPPVTLRGSELNTQTALFWICRIGDLSFRSDEARERIVFYKLQQPDE